MTDHHKPRWYPSVGVLTHYGLKNWDELGYLDSFVCSGCGIDYGLMHRGDKLTDKLCGRRYGQIVIVGYICGCERNRVNLVLLDDDDCIASHHTVNDAEMIRHWPEIAEFWIDDNEHDDYEYDPVTEEREYWPEWIKIYHQRKCDAETSQQASIIAQCDDKTSQEGM